MKENKYDCEAFFQKYSQMERSKKGLQGAAEWGALQKILPDFLGKSVLDLGCGYGWHCRLRSGASGQSMCSGRIFPRKCWRWPGEKFQPQDRVPARSHGESPLSGADV